MGRQYAWWTNATIARILVLHTCPGTVWGTASSQTAKFRSRRRAGLLIPTSRRRVSPQWCSSAHAWRPTRRPSRHQFQTPLRTYRTSRGRRYCTPSGVARRLDAGRASHRQHLAVLVADRGPNAGLVASSRSLTISPTTGWRQVIVSMKLDPENRIYINYIRPMISQKVPKPTFSGRVTLG